MMRWGLVAILWLAAFLRLYNLTAQGLEHDEVANWLIDRRILAGRHGIYFADAYGHEAGFHYLQTLSVALIGDNTLALRLPAALLGILVVAVSYRFVKSLYNQPTALIASAIVAVTFFPTFYSRLALRAIMLPLFSGLAGYFFWEGGRRRGKWKGESGKGKGDSFFILHPSSFILTSALFAGLSTYTYMASRVVPIFFGLFMGYGWVKGKVERGKGKGERGKDSHFILHPASFILIYALIAAPLFIWLRLNPGSEFRVSEIDQPLQALLAGDVWPVLQNAWRIVGVWGWSGDPLWRQNVAGMPIFNPLTAILFYAGIGLLLWRHKANDVFVLLWIATATIPSIVTADAPSTIRMINMLPLLGVPIAQVIHSLSMLSTNNSQLSTTFWQKSWITALTIMILLGSTRTFYKLNYSWPQGGDVPFVWQTALTNAARWLDQQEPLPTTILGWSPDTLDAPTIDLALEREDIALRFAGADNGVTAFVLPFADGDTVRVIRPKTPPINLALPLDDFLISQPAIEQPDFIAYQINLGDDAALASSYAAPFGNEFTLTHPLTCPTDGDTCTFRTIWLINTPASEPRAIFIHALDANGEIVGQSDVQLPAPQFWQNGDHLIAAHTLPRNGVTTLRIGIYNPITNQRLTTPIGADFIEFSLGQGN